MASSSSDPTTSKTLSEANSDVDLPVNKSSAGPKADPFGFEKALKAYSTEYKGVTQFLSKRRKAGKTSIGGDALDITTGTSAERKKFSFDGKTRLGRRRLQPSKEVTC